MMITKLSAALLILWITEISRCYALQPAGKNRSATFSCITKSCHSYSDQRPESYECSRATTCVTTDFCLIVQSTGLPGEPNHARRYSCFSPTDIVHHALTCGSNNTNDRATVNHYCCQSNLCNNITAPFLRTVEHPSSSTKNSVDYTILAIIAVAIATVLAVCILCFIAVRYWGKGPFSAFVVAIRQLFKKPHAVSAHWVARGPGNRDTEMNGALTITESGRSHNRSCGNTLAQCCVPASSESMLQPRTAVTVPRGISAAGQTAGSASQSRTQQTVPTCSTQLSATSPFRGASGGWTTDLQRPAAADESVCAMSSSGSGLPILERRTISREIDVYQLIGTGRYGSVYVGRWRDDLVAIKKFHSFEYEAFKHETDLYLTCMLFHANILRFIAVDSKDCVHCTEHWLITEYHELGSLFTFLTTHCVTVPQMLQLALSAATGLAHLQQTFNGQAGAGTGANASKPRIAHRDLKSHNILVKKDLTCAIGDLGAAITYDQHCAIFRARNGQPPTAAAIASRFRVGTRRYLAPEVLDDSIHYANFESLLAADVYSFALVCWELLRRTTPRTDFTTAITTDSTEISSGVASVSGTVSQDQTERLNESSEMVPLVVSSESATAVDDDGDFVCPEYALPYYETADRDPSDEKMKQIVCDQRCRPQIDRRALRDPVIAAVYATLCESWCSSPDARLSSPRIKKRFRELVNQLEAPTC